MRKEARVSIFSTGVDNLLKSVGGVFELGILPRDSYARSPRQF